MKKCCRTDCVHKGKPIPLDGFYTNKRAPDGLTHACKECLKAENRTARNNNTPEHQQRQILLRRKYNDYFMENLGVRYRRGGYESDNKTEHKLEYVSRALSVLGEAEPLNVSRERFVQQQIKRIEFEEGIMKKRGYNPATIEVAGVADEMIRKAV